VALELLQEFFLVELCRLVPSSRGIVNIVNPGFCYGSGLHTEVPGVVGAVLGTVKRIIGQTTMVGARTLVDGAVVQGAGSHGQYLSDCRLYE